MISTNSTSKLKEKLKFLQNNIAHFEKELICGVEKKQKQINQKFDNLKAKIFELSDAIDTESYRIASEYKDFSQKIISSTKLTHNTLTKFFNNNIINLTRTIDILSIEYESKITKLENLEKIMQNDELKDSLNKLTVRIVELRDFADQFIELQEKSHAEFLNYFVNVENNLTKDHDEWKMILVNFQKELMIFYKSLIEEKPIQDFDYDVVQQIIEKKEVVRQEYFDKYIQISLEDIKNRIENEVYERKCIDNEIMEAAERYIHTLRKSLEANQMLKNFANIITDETQTNNI